MCFAETYMSEAQSYREKHQTILLNTFKDIIKGNRHVSWMKSFERLYF